MYSNVLLVVCLFFLTNCMNSVNPPKNKSNNEEEASEVYLDKIKLPKGFSIDLYAEDVDNARSMCMSPSGTLFVGTRGLGDVYALKDTDGDYKVDQKYVIYTDGNMPNGVAFKDGDLYVAEVDRVLKFSDIENNLSNPPAPTTVYDNYPSEKHHGWKYIAFGPDGHLYIPVGAPCNICESEDKVFNSITRLDLSTNKREIVQEGVRNTVGFTWHPESGELWFTDNGRDWMGDDMPACELNKATADFQHFGYPYCHQGDTPDPEFGEKHSCDEFVAPVQNLGAHVAPLGVKFYNGNAFPEAYHNNTAFIAEHGSWNRSKKSGYKVSLVKLNDQHESIGYETFAEGWLDNSTDEVWGRPVDLIWLEDGSMLLSDDYANVIYRITYNS